MGEVDDRFVNCIVKWVRTRAIMLRFGFLADFVHRSLKPISTKVNAVQELKKALAHHKKYIKGS